MKQPFLPLGEIVAAHGVRGDVRVNPETDEPELLCRPGTLYYDAAGQQPFSLLRGAKHKNIYLLSIDGVNTPEQAAALRGRTIYARRSDFHLKPGEHFIADLLGMRVVDDRDSAHVYGVLTDVTDMGVYPLYELTDKAGKKQYLPAVQEFVRSVDEENGEIRVLPPEGLFDA